MSTALLILFVLALILAFVHYAQERSTLQAVAVAERFPEPSLSKFFLPNTGVFFFLMAWGEFAVGLVTLRGILTGIAVGFGVVMNLNYLLAGTVR